MKKLFFKSTDADLQKLFQLIEIQQKNILYLTYQVDKILKIARSDQVNESLQHQVDQYFEKDETSPQTDTEELGTN